MAKATPTPCVPGPTRATVYVKRSQRSEGNVARARKQCDLLNKLAQVLSKPELAAIKHHFAAEILKEVDATGHAVYYTPAVNGFTVEQCLADPGRFARHAPGDTLQREARRLREAVRQLCVHGFVHGDTWGENVMSTSTAERSC